MWADFHFLRPLWLLLPVAAAALALLPAWRGRRQGVWRPWVDDELVPWVLVRPGSSRAERRWMPLTVILTVALLGIACAGPTWERRVQPQVVSGHALVLALDLSRSMMAEDIRPSRLARARFKLADLIAARGSSQTGLIVYAADAFLVTPLTSDIETLRLQLPVLEPSLMPVQGSRADRAYARAAAVLRESGFPKGDVLLVTDEVTTLTGQRLVEACREQGNGLWILAVATAGGAPVPGAVPRETTGQGVVMSRLDLPALQAIAGACGGRAVELRNDDEDVLALERALEANALRERARDADFAALEWVDQGPWLLLLLLPLLAWQARGQVLSMLMLALLCGRTPEAQAFDSWRLWKHADEHARTELEEGRAAAAMQSFSDPRWKAWAAVEAGQLEAAVELLATLDDTESLYNRGTALARLGRLPEALQTLDAALEREPSHADARFNRDLIARLLEQQQDSADGTSGSGEKAEGEPDVGPRKDASPPSDPRAGERSEPSPGESPDTLPEPPEGGEASPSASPEGSAADRQPPEAGRDAQDARESAQATEQWLSRIADDPGGLLRNKFLYQSQRRRAADPPDQEPPW